MIKSLFKGGSIAAACLVVFACLSFGQNINSSVTASHKIIEKTLSFARLVSAFPMAQPIYSDGDYLADVCHQGMYEWPASRLPIKIYVSNGAGVPSYKPSYGQMIRNAFDQWCDASGNKLSWIEVRSPSAADIIVGWTTHVKQISTGTEAGETNALTRLNQATGHGIIYGARMNFLTQLNGVPFTDQQMKRTCLHEAGHALGLQGHSPNPGDVMYYAVSPNQRPVLSGRDRATMAHLYADAPSTDNVALK